MKVKICCIGSPDEAQLAIAAGATAIGLVSEMPSGPGVISDDVIREIALATPPPVGASLLTSRTTGTEIVEHAQHCATSMVQIVRHIDPAEHETMAQKDPRLKRVQVVHVTDRSCLDMIPDYGPRVHAFLLDSGWPDAAVSELGGTGRTHDWDISADFVERSPVPVFHAGGLNADNVRRSIDQVSPFGVDVCSGVRTNDQLDAAKLGRFMAQVNASRR